MEPGLSSSLTESDRPTHSGGEDSSTAGADPCTQWFRPAPLSAGGTPALSGSGRGLWASRCRRGLSSLRGTFETQKRALLALITNPTPLLVGLRSTGCVGSLG